jgi:hypothetical protein
MCFRQLQSLCLALCCAGLLHGQAELATVTGVVIDSAKAVIPGVRITVHNTDTDIAHTVATNQDGYYTVPELPAGPYVIEAVSSGFETYRQNGVVLETGQTFRADITMTVGSVNESVEITADVAALNTENGMVKGYVVTKMEIDEMPLNGRDFTELALYVPGVASAPAGEPGSFASINGARADSTNFVVDGIDDRNVRGAAAQLRPNIDAMQEFKMETSGYSAEYGKMAGGILNMVLRSGANAYHGTAFEYLRNDFFDAKAYFDTSRLPFHQNQFGGVISGPISIPKIYKGHDRTFFMFSWETLLQQYGQSYLGVVPTALEHAGNFSGDVSNTGAPITLKNPFSSYAVFPGNIIPTSLMSPIGQKIVSYYPLPNRTAIGDNYIFPAIRYNNFNSFITRGDHRIDEKNSVTVTYGKHFAWTDDPAEYSNLGLFGTTERDDRELGGLSFTHIFSPTVVSESRFGLSRSSTRDGLMGNYPTAAQLGMVGSSPGLPGFPAAFPQIAVTGYLAMGYGNNEPVQFFVTNYGFHETLTWIKGAHVMKMGADISRNRFNQPYFNNARGSMTASGIWTGNGTAANGDAIGDLLLGLLGSSSITSLTQNNYMRNHETAAFFTDDWKIRRDVTLNLGARYEVDSPPADLYGRVTNFLPQYGEVAVGNPANIPNYTQLLASNSTGALTVPASKLGIPQNSLIYTNYKGFAPRMGFAWRMFGESKTVLRGGYGIFFTGEQLNNIRNGLDNVFPAVVAPSFSRVTSPVMGPTLANPWGGTGSLGSTATGYPLHPANSYLQSYNLTIERELNRWMVLEAAFVGSKGTHLLIEDNINTPYRTEQYYQLFGVFPSPYGNTFGTINEWCLCTNSIYTAGQFTLRNRANGGVTYHISYTYSKSIDEASAGDDNGDTLGGVIQDPRNLSLSRARSDFDRGHVVQAVISYPLPMGRNKRFFASAGSVLNQFIGSWILASTSIFQTGSPMTVEDSSVNTAIGESVYPNRIANAAETTGVGRRGIDYPWFDPGDYQPVPGCASRTKCTPDIYGFLPFADGNGGRNNLDAPGMQNINLSLQKNWALAEKKTIQFRWEVFNIFNHPNFVLMNRNFNESAAGYLTSVAATGTGGPRIMQFALKYLF